MRYLILCWMLISTLAGATTPEPRVPDRPFPLGAPRALSATYAEGDEQGHALHAGLVQPTALASADYDEDGVEDLICGYATRHGGTVSLHRGNIDAIFPHSNEARERRLRGTFVDEPFLSPARAFDLPATPDFLAAGDFDADGHWDVVAAAKAEAGLYLMRGDGHGGLERERRIPLPGPVTALVAGEVNRADGLTDLAVGVRMPEAFAVLVFEGPNGALRSPPEKIELSSEPTSLLLARVLGGPWWDLAVAATDELLIVTGRDRRLVLDEPRRAAVAPPVVDRIGMPSAIEALAWGDFAWEPIATRELALLLEDGTIRLLQVHTENEGLDLSWKTIGEREVLAPRTPAAEMSSVRRLLPVRISGSPTEDLAILDAIDGHLDVLAGMVREDTANYLADPGVVVSLELQEPPIAALGMRLNRDAMTDLVLLRQGMGGPLVVETELLATITVNTAADNTATDGTCSLREALNNSNSDSDTTGGDCAAGAGADAIDFNIGDGGSTATIALTSALPVITDPVTIDGTTQDCASPPCIVLDGSGAGVVAAGLQIAGGSSSLRGLVIQQFQGDPGPPLRGLGLYLTSSGNIIEGNYSGTDVTGTVDLGNNAASLRIEDGSNNTVGGTIAGAANVFSGSNTANGVVIAQVAGTASGNQVLGNFIGTDVTGIAGLGNAADGVVINTSSNNTIGGTTAGARNVISANGEVGVRLTGSVGNQLLGNYIGTDVNGTADLGNGNEGVEIINAPSNTVGGTAAGAGNVISGNQTWGVVIWQPDATGNVVLGNLIGTDLTGTVALGNTLDGVLIQEAPSNTIGGTVAGAGNVIAGNDRMGIFILAPTATGTLVQGNFIGTDVTGTATLGNADDGIQIFQGQNITIGGTSAAARNIISSNGDDGVHIEGISATGNLVQGNHIGTDVSGTLPLGNGGDGVFLTGSAFSNLIGGPFGARNVISGNNQSGVLMLSGASDNTVANNFIGTDVSGTVDLGNGMSGVSLNSPNNTIGGTGAGARNIISGNDRDGVSIAGTEAQGNQVLGNFIGTDVTGTIAVGNLLAGVEIEGGSNNTIGGTADGAGNVISGNGDVQGWGVVLEATSNNEVIGNYIGTQVDGTSPLGNTLAGVVTADGASNNTIGGTGVTPGLCDGPCNRIGFTSDPGGDGVRILAGSGNGNAILGNSIFASAELGIDLGPSGMTPNDMGDPDAGANTLQNFPVLSLAAATPSGATVDGSLNSTPSRPFRLEFFANTACDASGHGEGSRFLGFTDVLTDVTGNVSFSAALSGPVSDGESITGTASSTGLSTNTSEFSECLTATCLSTAAFGQTVIAQDKNSLSWGAPDHIRFVKGNLADVSSYLFTATEELPAATSLDISSDNPGSGDGLYYLVRSLACGSWQTSPGAEPQRDSALP